MKASSDEGGIRGIPFDFRSYRNPSRLGARIREARSKQVVRRNELLAVRLHLAVEAEHPTGEMPSMQLKGDHTADGMKAIPGSTITGPDANNGIFITFLIKSPGVITRRSFNASIFVLAPLAAVAKEENYFKLAYDGGSLPDIKAGVGLRLYIETSQIRIAHDKETLVATLPANSIVEELQLWTRRPSTGWSGHRSCGCVPRDRGVDAAFQIEETLHRAHVGRRREEGRHRRTSGQERLPHLASWQASKASQGRRP